MLASMLHLSIAAVQGDNWAGARASKFSQCLPECQPSELVAGLMKSLYHSNAEGQRGEDAGGLIPGLAWQWAGQGSLAQGSQAPHCRLAAGPA